MNITWWDAVDCIGVDVYYRLTDKNDPTVEKLKAAWIPYVNQFSNLSTLWTKQIIFTEIGFSSADGTNKHPWEYSSEADIDLQEQADCYQATFESIYNQSWLAGFFWWAWGKDPFEGGPCSKDFIPYDKPAEDILRSWYGAPPVNH